ncbi:MAG: ATP-binding protein [Victivallaceae bacterium]|nr:ATP-binding protein [Victivallaceae bacterium]
MNAEYDWESIIYRGVESDELDYKAAQDWSKLNRAGRAKFARHCLAMANTKGGYVVVGVGEDESGQPTRFTGLTEEQAKSFDPTNVGNFINRFADPQIDFTIERPEVDKKRYAVFVIRRFQNMPHVCPAGCEHELLQGVFYIRTADASSRPAYRSSEIHALIQRALRNQRELLGRMIRGILYEGHMTPAAEQAQSHFSEELNHSAQFFNKRFKPKSGFFGIEFSAAPSEYVGGKFSLSELRRSAESAFNQHRQNDFIAAHELETAYSSNVSLRAVPEGSHKQWQIFQSGLFHLIGYYPLDDKNISYQFLVGFFAGAITFIADLYSELGYTDEPIQIKVTLRQVENMTLSGLGKKSKVAFTCRIPEITVKLSRATADLSTDPAAHAAQLVRPVCERFNVPDGRFQNLLPSLRKMIN